MKATLSFLVSLFILWAVFVQAQSPVGPEINVLNEVTCQNEQIEISIAKGRASIGNTDISVDTRLFNAQFPGPVVRMKAGKTCRIKFSNDLPTNTAVSSCTGHENGLHCPDTSNLHTHGLHITPKGNGDNINITVLPGESHIYEYDVMEKSLMGTHWYHPHRHGATALQTVGGAFGMLLVDPADSYDLPSDLKALYKKERLIAFNDFDFRDGPEAYVAYIKSWIAIANSYSVQTIPPNLTIGESTNPHFIGVNGQYRPYFTVDQGEVFLLRMVHASGTRPMELIQTGGPQCQMVLLARDGIFHRTPYLQLPVLVMLHGTRADVAFKCSGPGLVTFSAVPQPGADLYFGGFPSEERLIQDNVFQIVVNPSSKNEQFPTSEVDFPDYLQNLLDDTPDRSFEVELAGSTLLTEGEGMSWSEDTGVNDVIWQGWEEPHWTETLCKNTLYRIVSKGAHPYHQHINHFQIQKTLAPDYIVRVGEFRDVVLGGDHMTEEEREVFYMKTFDYSGVYILHCHIVEHEDGGLMGGYLVEECAAQTSTSATSGSSGSSGSTGSSSSGSSSSGSSFSFSGGSSSSGSSSSGSSFDGSSSSPASRLHLDVLLLLVVALFCILNM